MEIEGKVILDLGMTSGTSKAGNAWKKKEIVIETFGTYPRKVKMTLFGDRSETVGADVGQSYSFSVDVESREYMGRWYTDVSAYSSRLLNTPTPGETFAQPMAAPAQPVQQPAVAAAPTATPADPFGSSDSDDLPF
ncbi:DUF3127 domain-containing protein [bacterium]|nr:DUF3127 domain-containing protein [Bacteroides sp.]MBD5386898.1 DUF3127 domain-containing protein [bacterium]